ncbi:MAG: HAD-IA family hydrolase [Firmicutes bacterium]|nr:HAD-IA family hydrolase [Bacillota bacterium]
MKTKFNKVLFDLDGTITDSKEGILNSLRYALDKMKLEQYDDEFLMSFVGPPLMDSFINKAKLSVEKAEKALGFYRERFQTIGIYENKLYPGIRELLHLLSQRNDISVYIATAKPLPYAIRVLEYFKIIKYFDDISGSTLDGSVSGKTQVITNLLNKFKPDFNRESTLMIGDRDHDIIGAKENGIKSLGVLYGYGDLAEVRDADYLVESVIELQKFLLGGK